MSGARADEFIANAESILDSTRAVTVISQIPEFEPREADDYINVPACHTTCELLGTTIWSGVELMQTQASGGDAAEKTPALFQINHARIIEPSSSDNLLTKGQERLFPVARIVDRTGALELRMREKVALELSGQISKEDFIHEAESGGLNYPILCSVRVLVKKTTASGNAGAAEHNEELSASIVATEPQSLEAEAAPNKSWMELQAFLNVLPLSTERMIVAPVAAIRCSPHGGMVVSLGGKVRHCSCVLTFIAHTGKSHVDTLPSGHRIVSNDIWNTPSAVLLIHVKTVLQSMLSGRR